MKTTRALIACAALFSVCICSFVPRTAQAFAVSTGTIWATEAATEILKQGGNAADAMVAASFVMNVTQPYNMGIGGGGFFLAAKNGKAYFWDHRETAPASAKETMFLGADGKPIPYYPQRVTGPLAVGVPGTVLGLMEAHRKLGKLSWKKLLQPSIRLAREGFPITSAFEFHLKEEWERISRYPATAALFSDGEGSYLKTGAVLRNPMLAKTLEEIANKGGREFYHGALATRWISEARKLGVKIELEDLKNYRVRQSEPVRFKVFGQEALTAPPPSAAGIMVAASLRYLEHYYRDHELAAPGSALRVLVTVETLRYFQALRDRSIADPPAAKLDPNRYLNSVDEKKAWGELDAIIRSKREKIETKVTAMPLQGTIAQALTVPRGHTTHLSIVDDQGMAVSYTTTIEQWFGSGMLVPGLGFLLNNELSDFNAEPGHPNSPAPGKRPRSNMSPLIFFDRQKPTVAVGVVGCAGGARIPTSLVEILENYYLHQMTARASSAFARFHPNGGKIEIEASLPQSTLEPLKDSGYNLEVGPIWTTAQLLLRRTAAEKWEAAAEPRSDSAALSW